MVDLVEEAEGLVRVVCADAQPANRARATTVKNIGRMFIPFFEIKAVYPIPPTR
jgi:hypothetical protein